MEAAATVEVQGGEIEAARKRLRKAEERADRAAAHRSYCEEELDDAEADERSANKEVEAATVALRKAIESAAPATTPAEVAALLVAINHTGRLGYVVGAGWVAITDWTAALRVDGGSVGDCPQDMPGLTLENMERIFSEASSAEAVECSTEKALALFKPVRADDPSADGPMTAVLLDGVCLDARIVQRWALYAAATSGPTVSVRVRTPSDAVMFSGGGWAAVVMPLREGSTTATRTASTKDLAP